MSMLGFVIFLALVIYPLLAIIGWLLWRVK
jgi:hypothetical protein